MNDAYIPPTLSEDIRTAIIGLDGLRNSGHDRDAIVWAQYVLTACARLIDADKPPEAMRHKLWA